MNGNEYEKLKSDYMIKTFVQEEQFGQWLRKFFYLNHELNKEYDSIYQDSFYVVFYELVTIGIEYGKNILDHLKSGNNKEKTEFYFELIKGLENLKSKFSETEFQFIEYKRHSVSHIFQNHYENRISDSGKYQTKRKGKSIDDNNSELKSVILENGSDKEFDINMTKKLYPNITEMYTRLEQIKTHYNKK